MKDYWDRHEGVWEEKSVEFKGDFVRFKAEPIEGRPDLVRIHVYEINTTSMPPVKLTFILSKLTKRGLEDLLKKIKLKPMGE